MTDQTGTHLLNQELALEEYLGHLLTPSDQPDASSENDADRPKSVVHPFPKRPRQDDIPVVKPVVVKSNVVPEEPIDKLDQPAAQASESSSNEIVPPWGQNSFECASILVDGIPMLFPSRFIKEVIPYPEKLRPLNKQPEWVLGLAIQEHGFVAVVDSMFLFFKKNTSSASVTNPSRYRQILVFGDGRWGLACERVERGQRVMVDEVRWRTDNSHRKWLAGMIKQPAAPLINPEQLFEEI